MEALDLIGQCNCIISAVRGLNARNEFGGHLNAPQEALIFCNQLVYRGWTIRQDNATFSPHIHGTQSAPYCPPLYWARNYYFPWVV